MFHSKLSFLLLHTKTRGWGWM